MRRFLAVNPLRWTQIIVFALIGVLYVVWTWNTELGERGGDNAYYLLTAQYYSLWSSPSDVTAYFATNNLYPPLYPFLLSLVGGGESVLVAHVVTTGFLLAGFIVLYCWMRSLGFARMVASAGVLLFACLPGVYLQALAILSENLYLLLSLVAITAVTVYESSERWAWLIIAAISVSAAMLARSAGVTLLVTYIAYLVWHRPPRFLWGIAVALLPVTAWNLFHQSHGLSYTAALTDKYGSNFIAALTDHLQIQAHMLWRVWVETFTRTPIGIPIISIVGVAALAGTAVRIWQKKFDGFYIAIYLALILAWPFPAEVARLVFVIVPIMLVHLLLISRTIPGARFGDISIGASLALLCVILLLALPQLVLTVQRFVSPQAVSFGEFRREFWWYYQEDRDGAVMGVEFNRAAVKGMRAAANFVPENECIYSIKPSILGFYAKRVSIVPPPEQIDDASFRAAIKASRCRYFFFIGSQSPSYRRPFYPMERLGLSSLRILNITKSPIHSAPITILAILNNK